MNRELEETRSYQERSVQSAMLGSCNLLKFKTDEKERSKSFFRKLRKEKARGIVFGVVIGEFEGFLIRNTLPNWFLSPSHIDDKKIMLSRISVSLVRGVSSLAHLRGVSSLAHLKNFET